MELCRHNEPMAWTRIFIRGPRLSRARCSDGRTTPASPSPSSSTSSTGTGRCRPRRRWRSALWAAPRGCGAGTSRHFPDIGGYGNHEYGNRVGIFRILAVLDKYGIKPTLALDKAVADHYPFLIKEGQRRDAEFIAHGLSRRRLIHIGMSEDEERQYIRDSIAAVEQATGKRPVGWSGPDFQETPNTPDLLAAEGIRYVCDWGNDEQPYKMTPKTGELYSLGVNAYLDDNYIHLHGRRTINEVNRLWREWFDGLYADGATTGRVMVLHLHPWIMGQPWRIRHLDEVLGHITAHAGVWKATGSEIIDWFKAQSGSPRRLACADAAHPSQVNGEDTWRCPPAGSSMPRSRNAP